MNRSVFVGYFVRRTVLIVLLTLASGCGKKSSTGPSDVENRTIGQFYLTATAVGETTVSATTRAGSPPAAGSGPTAIAASVNQTADAGLNLVSIQGSAPFQTIYLSVGSAETALLTQPGLAPAWAARVGGLLEAPLSAAPIQTTGFLQIDLPAAVTSASVIVGFASSLPPSFEMKVQLGAPGGAVGPGASLPKTLQSGGGLIEIVGVVLSTFGPNPANPTGPGLYGPPVAGAVVSTSLDSRTAVTDTNGAFDLLTNTTNLVGGRCFRLMITAPGFPPYSSDGWIGSNKETGGVRFTLSPPQPPNLKNCT